MFLKYKKKIILCICLVLIFIIIFLWKLNKLPIETFSMFGAVGRAISNVSKIAKVPAQNLAIANLNQIAKKVGSALAVAAAAKYKADFDIFQAKASTYEIYDPPLSMVTASSVYNQPVNNPKIGIDIDLGDPRRSSGSAWLKTDTDTNPYITYNFGTIMPITGIITLGRNNNVYSNQYVKTYFITYTTANDDNFIYINSSDSIDFSNVIIDGQALLDNTYHTISSNNNSYVFKGNKDMSNKYTNIFDRPINAYKIRIYPQAYNVYPCMRIGFLVSKIKPTIYVAPTVYIDPVDYEKAAKDKVKRDPQTNEEIYSYLGCYKDKDDKFPNVPSIYDIEGRAFPDQLAGEFNKRTVEECYNLAEAKNYNYFGLQADGQCFGGNLNDPINKNDTKSADQKLSGPRYAMYGKIDTKECNPVPDRPGGGYNNLVYKINENTSPFQTNLVSIEVTQKLEIDNNVYRLLDHLYRSNTIIRTPSSTKPNMPALANSRINEIKGWILDTPQPQNYLKFDLGNKMDIYGIVTQGSGDSNDSVTKYKILYSDTDTPSTIWNLIKNSKTNKTVIDGNISSNPNQMVYNMFNTQINARYFVIYIKSYSTILALRADLIVKLPEIEIDKNTRYEYSGCFTKNKNLNHQFSNNYGSVNECYDVAFAEQYDFFGLRNNGECWGGNNNRNVSDIKTLFTTQTDAAKCINLLGNPKEDDAIKIYNINSPIPKNPNFDYKGCYNDKTDNRALSVFIGNVNNTIDCYNTTKINDYDIFGLQNGGECWAEKNTLDSTVKYSKHNGATNCDILGNNLKIQTYQIKKQPTPEQTNPFVTSPNYDYKGCYADKDPNQDDTSIVNHALSYRYDNVNVETVDQCYQLTKNDTVNNYDLFGLVNGSECYGGSSADTSPYSKNGSAVECELLGSPFKAQIYKIKNTETVTSSPFTTQPYIEDPDEPTITQQLGELEADIGYDDLGNAIKKAQNEVKDDLVPLTGIL